jgi:hypothetical protein
MKKLIFLSAFALFGCAHSAMNRLPAEDHSRHKEMATSAPKCMSWNQAITPAQQKVVDRVMGSREHRLHHALWHAARGGLRASEVAQLTNAFGPTWQEARPLCPSPRDASSSTYNPVGEDFLYMHRTMISMLQAAFIEAGLPCVKGWDHVPSLAEFAPPDSDREGAKSDQALVRLKEWDEAFRNPEWLKTKTLSQVGWALENTLHNNLHMRFATTNPPRGYTDAAPIGFDGKFPYEWTYDRPAYNWLADPYGAALNPTFWKIHGYVDSIIDRWLEANRFTSIADECHGLASCYEWKGKWLAEVSLPKSMPDRVSRGQGDSIGGGIIDPKARLKLQRLGVLTEEDLKPKRGFPDGAVGGPKGGAIDPNMDPYLFAKARICKETR